eukprot:2693546-Rhodomonas_salina.1
MLSSGSTTETAPCACNIGYFHSASGSCELCDTGSYNPSTGQSACQLCPPNQFLPTVGATDEVECRSCPAGSTSGSGSSVSAAHLGKRECCVLLICVKVSARNEPRRWLT